MRSSRPPGEPPSRGGRYEPTADRSKTVLGEEQWAWFEERLREPAELRVVVSSIQLIAEDHGWESWSNFPHERERFFALLAETRAEGVVVVSGDRHAAEISVLEPANDGRDPGYRLYDVTSSSMNRPRNWTFEENRHREGDMYAPENFGTIEVDWEREDPEVRLSIRDVEGRVVLRSAVTLGALAAAEDREPFLAARVERIAFGSCNQQDDPTPIWEDVVATDPELFLFLGDNVYGDTHDMEHLRAQYEKLGAQPGFHELRLRAPSSRPGTTTTTAGTTPDGSTPRRPESQRILLGVLRGAGGLAALGPRGVYGSWVLGPADERVQVILLDLRSHRTPWGRKASEPEVGDGHPGPYAPPADPDSTILGEAQWRWLAEELRVPARVRIIGSSLPVLAEGSDWETWSLMPTERERLFAEIRAAGATGVVFLSGDTHWAELSRVDPVDSGVPYTLWDLTSSGLNQAWQFTNMKNPNRVGVPLFEPKLRTADDRLGARGAQALGALAVGPRDRTGRRTGGLCGRGAASPEPEDSVPVGEDAQEVHGDEDQRLVVPVRGVARASRQDVGRRSARARRGTRPTDCSRGCPRDRPGDAPSNVLPRSQLTVASLGSRSVVGSSAGCSCALPRETGGFDQAKLELGGAWENCGRGRVSGARFGPAQAQSPQARRVGSSSFTACRRRRTRRARSRGARRTRARARSTHRTRA